MPPPVAEGGLRLHHLGSRNPPRNRRRLLLLVVLLGVTTWGAVSVRRGDIVLDRLDEQAVEVLQAVPGLVSQGREWVLSVHR